MNLLYLSIYNAAANRAKTTRILPLDPDSAKVDVQARQHSIVQWFMLARVAIWDMSPKCFAAENRSHDGKKNEPAV